MDGILAELMGRDLRDVVFVGLAPEWERFQAKALSAGFTDIRPVVADPSRPGEFFRLILEIFSQSAGLEQGTLATKAGFQELMAALEEIGSQA